MVGALDVDAQRGALLEREQGVAAIRARAGQIILQRMQTATDLPGCCSAMLYPFFSQSVVVFCHEADPVRLVGLTGGQGLSILRSMKQPVEGESA